MSKNYVLEALEKELKYRTSEIGSFTRKIENAETDIKRWVEAIKENEEARTQVLQALDNMKKA